MIMKVLDVLFPEMLGVIDIGTQHAYPPEWVKYVAICPEAVDAHDLFGLYITGSEERNEVWICTLGLWSLGMRELEVIGANTENFGIYAEMADEVAAQVVESGILPDAGQPMARCFRGEETEVFTWGLPSEHLQEGMIASEIERSFPAAALLVHTEEGDVLPPVYFGDTEELEYPNPTSAFRRRIHLAKSSFGLFREVVQRPFERAAVRLEFELDDDAAEKFGYGIELLWAEISHADNGCVFAKIMETSEAVPQIKKGDEVEVTEENIAAWMLQPQGAEQTIRENTGYLLMKEGCL